MMGTKAMGFGTIDPYAHGHLPAWSAVRNDGDRGGEIGGFASLKMRVY